MNFEANITDDFVEVLNFPVVPTVIGPKTMHAYLDIASWAPLEQSV